jgi:hypothetical protein
LPDLERPQPAQRPEGLVLGGVEQPVDPAEGIHRYPFVRKSDDADEASVGRDGRVHECLLVRFCEARDVQVSVEAVFEPPNRVSHKL